MHRRASAPRSAWVTPHSHPRRIHRGTPGDIGAHITARHHGALPGGGGRTTHPEKGDGRWPDGTAVPTPFPVTPEQGRGDRDAWPWLPGTVIGQCGPDEWDVMVEVRELATLDDGTPALPGAHWGDPCYPCAYRDS